MSFSQTQIPQFPTITTPSSVANQHLPPPTDEKQFAQVYRVIALFEEIRTGRHIDQQPWTEFWLAEGDYDEVERHLELDEELWGYVKDKIRHDYSRESHCLVIRMPTAVHELFIARAEDAIFSQLKSIREGLSAAAAFAQKVYPARSTEIYFPLDDATSGRNSKHEPDASFWHNDAKYPGVVIEVACSQKKKRLGRLAEDYLLDSDANIRIVVGLDIEYGKRGSRKATLSVWRTDLLHTPEGDELRVIEDTADEPFRDDQGKPTDHPGLKLHLSDFAHKGLLQEEIESQDQDLVISARQLCEFLAAAEAKVCQKRSLSSNPIPPGVKKRRRS